MRREMINAYQDLRNVCAKREEGRGIADER